ncbi:flavin reductase [Fodinibius halophilus]|uniref:Flavin reductase n=1 Tax=Fodinibius halophilus TaxID=1736908 RepID=A0A6M1TJN3_9BACT|nr:flavin reductase [Fodinibius halophilus]NGP88810.1 flavin reductase [Fodinibius halophilus]
MADQEYEHMVDITGDPELWNRCYTVHSLVVIGSTEENGDYNFAPKHMSMPLGFGPYFGFMGTPRKTTYQNIEREKVFTVSYPSPDQLVFSSLMASRREADDSKPVVDEIPTVEAQQIEGKFLKDSYFQLECKLSQILGKFGEWEIIAGEVVSAHVHKDALKREGHDISDDSPLQEHPLLAYLHPGRFSTIKESNVFPIPKNFKR